MGWIRKIEVSHQCELPDRMLYAAGSEWECDTCGRRFTLEHTELGSHPNWVHDASQPGQGVYYFGA